MHRHELRGALHGLFRVRCFNQDDAHLFVRPDQLTDEIVGVVNLIDSVYQKFGFKYHVELSTRPRTPWFGRGLGSRRGGPAHRSGAAAHGLRGQRGRRRLLRPQDRLPPGGLARPYLAVRHRQLDFQMPLNFDLEYVDADGTRSAPSCCTACALAPSSASSVF
ncbi:MAG: aminoacyl--tRNA ligase-related protein [Collinsella sp.]